MEGVDRDQLPIFDDESKSSKIPNSLSTKLLKSQIHYTVGGGGGVRGPTSNF